VLNLTLWGKMYIIKMVVTSQFNYISMMSLSQKHTTQTDERNVVVQHSKWAWARAHTISSHIYHI